MDKDKLYYIVEEGTNNRQITHTGGVLICTEKGKQAELDWANHNATDAKNPLRYEAISIPQYEETFMEKKKTPSKEEYDCKNSTDGGYSTCDNSPSGKCLWTASGQPFCKGYDGPREKKTWEWE